MRTTRHPAATRHRSVPATSVLSDAIGQALHTPRIKHRASAALMLAALALAAPVAQSTDWIGPAPTDLNWHASSNWNAGVPNANTDANINNGGTASIAAGMLGEARDLRIGFGNVRVQGAGALSTQYGLIGNGAMFLDGGTWNTGGLDVGAGGTGAVNISLGGSLNSISTVVGLNAGDAGTVNVDDSVWTNTSISTIGQRGTGTLNVRNGGSVSNTNVMFIGSEAGSLGTVTVDGAGSSLDSNGELTVGYHGEGRLTVSGGAYVESGPDAPALMTAGIRIGDEAGSKGTVTVQGAGSRLFMANDAYIGNRGTGSLQVLDGGTVVNKDGLIGAFGAGGAGSVLVDGVGSTGVGSTWSNNSLSIGFLGEGSMTIRNGGAVNSVYGQIGEFAGSRGTVLVDGPGSLWTNLLEINVGNFAEGAMTIRNGGAVVSGAAVIGANLDSIGTLTVEGANSRWDITDTMRLGGLGTGTATIRDGGTVNSTTGDVGAFGFTSGVVVFNKGSIVLEGAGSSWNIAESLDVGRGNGSLTVRDAAALSSGDAFIGNWYSPRFDTISGLEASVLVDGSGSTWASTGTITVGTDGNGLLTVRNGGAVSSQNGVIGLNARSTEGAVVIDGPGSSWTNADTLTVGVAGQGSLTVQNGGALNSRFAAVGRDAGSAGSVQIDGTGSTWTNSAGMGVGVAGDGMVRITDGGRVNSSDIVIGAGSGDGSLQVSGTGSRADIAETMVGWLSDGELIVEDGGSVSSVHGYVAEHAGTQGSVRVEGAGSRWAVQAGPLDVGDRGAGTLTVVDGGTVAAPELFLARNAGSIGTIHIGEGGLSGTLEATQVSGGAGTATVNFNHSDDVSTATAFLGSLAFNKLGTGTLLLAGTSDYTGATQVQAGTLMVEGALGNTTTTVFDGATLGGTGSIAGDVIVNDGATIAPGMSPGTLTVGSLSLSSGSILEYELGQAGVIGSGINDLIEIDGSLTLDGTINITDAGGFGAGVYRLMNYGGSFTDNGLDLGALPTGFTTNDLFVQTAIVGQVNLINSAGESLNFWDGAAGPTDDGIIQGGDGVWVSNDRSWTNPDGSLNGNWNQGFAIFGGAAGTVTVMGEQNFTGMQFMTDGYRLEAGTDGALHADGVTNLRVDPNVTATIATPIVGDATLVKVDEGTLVFQGAFGYTGGVTVNGGRLIGDSDNLLGNILNRAELEFAQNDDGTYAGNMTGEGALTKSGAGTLTLTGNNSHSGGTTIEAGTLQVGDGGTSGGLAGDVEIQADGTLAFNRNDNIGFAGAFSGDGALDKFGAGTLSLSGDSSAYAGQGTVHAGGLQVDGSLGGDLAVLAGATLSGTGTLGSVDNAGTIAPGGAIGTLTLTGDYVHRDGATYQVDIDADGNSDLLDVAGSAKIEGGDVQVAGVPGQYGGVTRYTIVDADGGVSGTYDALSDSLLFLDLVLAYDPNHVYLDVLRNDTSFGSLCGTGSFNQCEVAKTLDSFDPVVPPTVDIGKMIAQVTTLDAPGALAAFDRLSGEAHPSLAGIVLEGHALYGQTVTRRMAERREAIGADRLKGGAWVRAYGASSELDGDGNAHGADWDLRGVAVGYDAWGSENWLIGASVNAMHLEADFRPGDRGDVDAKNVSLYTSFQGERAYLDAVVSYAWWDNDVTRSIQVGNIDRTATSSYNSHRFATYLEGGWTFNLGERSLLQPMLTLQYDNLASQAFREEGAQDLSLIGRSDSVERLTIGAGARWSSTFKRGDWTLEPTVQARWLHSEGDDYAEFDVAFAGAPDEGYRTPEFGWRVRGVTLPQDRGLVGLGIAARNDNLDLFVDYDYQAGDGFKAHNLGAGLRYRW
jgi:fibronectin-binding autotransporter adhesin